MHPVTQRALLALLIQGSLLAGCAGTGPSAPATSPDHSSCGDFNGSFLFAGVARSCQVRGHLGGLPTYPIRTDGGLRDLREREDFLPLPILHWADPGSRVTIRQTGCSRLAISLDEAGDRGTPYLAYEIDLAALARGGTVGVSRTRISFEGPVKEELQLHILGISASREGWSMSRDKRGSLIYSYSVRTKSAALFFLLPQSSYTEVRCVLPQVAADSTH